MHARHGNIAGATGQAAAAVMDRDDVGPSSHCAHFSTDDRVAIKVRWVLAEGKDRKVWALGRKFHDPPLPEVEWGGETEPEFIKYVDGDGRPDIVTTREQVVTK